jgi:patatin-like phospholipase/acyl hydrolase
LSKVNSLRPELRCDVDMSKRRPFRILALAGGGYLGLYTASVLARLEARAGVALGQRFDLIAGTSVGGILALGLAYEIPVEKIRRLFVERGARIFSTRPLATGAVGRLVDLTRSVWGPKYSSSALRKALSEHLGELTLGQAGHALVVPALDVRRSMTKIFKTPHGPRSTGDETARAVDVAMATCAAPSYFPSVPIGDSLYADGGVFAVAPDLVALHEAEQFLDVDLRDISMLSIGTATLQYAPAEGVSADDGAIGWMSEGRFVLTMISAQQQHVQAMMLDRLGDRYTHLDAVWPPHAGLGIDVATKAAARALTELADDTLQHADLGRLDREFLNPRGA